MAGAPRRRRRCGYDARAGREPRSVVLVTTHVPFRDVPALLTVDRVMRTGRTRSRRCATGGESQRPRLAVCAVNPHAGESGLFGDEEERVLRPAAEASGRWSVPGGYGVRPRDAGRVRCGARALSRCRDDGDQGGGVRPGGERDAGVCRFRGRLRITGRRSTLRGPERPMPRACGRRSSWRRSWR